MTRVVAALLLTLTLLFAAVARAQQSPVLGPMLWSDCSPTPPRMLLTFAEYEALDAALTAAQTPAEQPNAIHKARAILRMSVGIELGARPLADAGHR